MSDKQIRADMEWLLSQGQFRRFLWRAIQMGRVFDQTGIGKSERDLAYAMGRRDLALELLSDAERGQPAEHPEGIPLLTAIQIMREAAQQPTERKGSKDRYDRRSEIIDDADEPAGDADAG